MQKIFLIATVEFTSIIRTKAFLFGLFILPAVVAGMIVLQSQIAKEGTDTGKEAASRELMARLFNYALPGAMVFLLFILVMLSIQPLLTTVLEEKMSRISEVLLGMVDPFPLMLGKLFGGLAASFLVAVLYVGSALFGLFYLGYLSMVPISAFAYLLVFLFPAILLFGSVYLAVGAACNDVKDAQALLTPFMVVMMTPLMILPILLQKPDGAISVALSLFPLSAPFVMLMRVSMQPGPPTWQVLLSLFLTISSMIGLVHLAGRAFRVGLLMQGKAPSLREFLKWMRA